MRTFRTDLADEIIESETTTDLYTQKNHHTMELISII